MTTPSTLLLGCSLLTVCLPPEKSSKAVGPQEEKVARLEHMKQAAKGYEITLASETSTKLTLIEAPLLRFDDQVTGVVDGTVFVWMLDDRPAATASIWIRKTGHEFHEFQSLTVGGLIASSEGQERWTPTKPGIERKPSPIAQRPAVSAAARLKEMRAFAGEYKATVMTSEKDQQELRLLPQPVYRYGRADGTVVDGAIFAYCKGTNPEILLLVEAVRNGKELDWNYAFARMTSRGCEARRADKVVWSAPRLFGSSPTDPYFNVVQRYNGPRIKEDATPNKDK
jgi:hypothetical protein